mmetsp:Transcript_76118/g.144837  ORF Transcript_76118/g.144837 Transcript_76118/m.144837 type:complete len:280 (+) Transcript_76118:394-1233(+)
MVLKMKFTHCHNCLCHKIFKFCRRKRDRVLQILDVVCCPSVALSDVLVLPEHLECPSEPRCIPPPDVYRSIAGPRSCFRALYRLLLIIAADDVARLLRCLRQLLGQLSEYGSSLCDCARRKVIFTEGRDELQAQWEWQELIERMHRSRSSCEEATTPINTVPRSLQWSGWIFSDLQESGQDPSARPGRAAHAHRQVQRGLVGGAHCVVREALWYVEHIAGSEGHLGEDCTAVQLQQRPSLGPHLLHDEDIVIIRMRRFTHCSTRCQVSIETSCEPKGCK